MVRTSGTTDRQTALMVLLLVCVIFVVDLTIPLGVACAVPYALAVLLSLRFARRRYILVIATITSLLTILGLVLSPPGGTLWMVIFNRILALVVIWVTAVFAMQLKHAQQALRSSEVSLRQIIDLIPHMVFAKDEQGRILFANRAVAESFGMTVEELIGRLHADVHANREEAARMLADDRKVLESGEPLIVPEEPFTDSAGNLHWLHTIKVPYVASATAKPALLGMAMDVTELREAERLLKESEANLVALIENSRDLIWSVDRHQHLITFNTAFAVTVHKTLGIEVRRGMSLDISRSPQRRAWWRDQYQRALRRERFTEDYPSDPSLPEQSYEVSFNPIMAGDEAIGVSCFMRDITDRKQAETALRNSEERYRVLFEQSADATLVIDGNKFVDCNDATVQMLRYKRKEDLLKTHPSELSPEFQPDGVRSYEKANDMMALAFVKGSHRFEWDHRRADGEVFPVEVLLTSIPSGEKCLLHVVWRDITERKLAEKEREELIGQLEAQNAELERFTYTVSHDLKSPLVTLKGFLGLLQQDMADGNADAIQSDIMRMNTAADRMAQLLSELLELSRIGRLVNVSERVPLQELVDEALELVAGRISQRGVQVVIRSPLPSVVGDRRRLVEVLQNLIDNAAKYMGNQPAPRIEIGAAVDRGETVCYVRDNGLGIEPCYHEKIFGLFDKLDPQSEGSGIGLALAKRIVKVHGGRLWVESDGPGSGATFLFALPLTPLQQAPAAKAGLLSG